MVAIFIEIAYYNINRTPHTSHVSDVSHGETFFLGDKDWIIQAKWKWITNRIVITKKQ